MTTRIDPGLFIAVLLGCGAMVGLSLHPRVWSARKNRIHMEAEAFSGHIDQRD